MKKRDLIFTGMVGILTAGALAGCSAATGGGTATPVKVDVTLEELAKTASEKLNDIKSVEFDYDLGVDYEMSASGTSMTMKIDGDVSGESVREPLALHMKMDMDVDVFGMNSTINNEGYIIQDDDGNYIRYSKESEDGQEGSWTKAEVESDDDLNVSALTLSEFDIFEKIADGSVKAELEETSEKINGKDVYKTNATITGDVFEDAMPGLSGSDALSMLGEGDISDMEMDADIYIYKDSGLPARVYMDAAEAAKKMIENMSSAGQIEDYDMKFNEYYVDLTYDNYDTFTTIEIPADVLQARSKKLVFMN